MNYIIIAIVIIGFTLWAIVSIMEWLIGTTNKLKTQWSVDTSKNIVERNQDVIQPSLAKIYSSDRAYYIDNEVRDCISKIALKEGRSDLAPKYREWLSEWQNRPGIPKEYLDLKNHLKELFLKKYNDCISKQRAVEEKRERENQEAIAKEGQKLFDRNKDMIDKFLEITERKVSVIDDYGDENWEVLSDEIVACLKKIAQREQDNIDWQGYLKGKRSLPDKYGWLENKLGLVFKEYHETYKSKPAGGVNFNDLSGVEFEAYIVKVLKENGYEDIRGTPATGDQGADLITKKHGKTIVIQAKRYKGAVGNKAVQEIIAALSFYSGDEGWVITNSTFTQSAKALAQKANVKLIDGKALEDMACLNLSEDQIV